MVEETHAHRAVYHSLGLNNGCVNGDFSASESCWGSQPVGQMPSALHAHKRSGHVTHGVPSRRSGYPLIGYEHIMACR